MKRILSAGLFGLAFLAITSSCGRVEQAVTAVSNDTKIPGRWLLSETQHANVVTTALAANSVVLTFKDGKTAYAPTDTAKGKIFSAFSKCKQGVRPYKMDGAQLVFVAANGCPEQRVTIQQLDATTLKFPDADDATVTNVFTKIDENRYMDLVKAADRSL